MISAKVTNPNILLLLFIFILKFFAPLTPDEAEHLHFSYLVYNGKIPFVDFWEHHMPLIWYLFLPINLGGNFFFKIVISKTIQSFLILISSYFVSLNFPKKNRNLIKFLFISMIIIFNPWINYGDIRPEIFFFLAVPILILFIKNKNFFHKNITSFTFIAIILSITFFFSPRGIPLIIIGLLYVLYKYGFLSFVNFIILGILTTLGLLFLFDFKDIIFFVFTQTSSLSYNLGPLFQINKIFVILFFATIFLFILLKRDKKFIDYFYIISFLFIFLEKKPNIENSTITVLIISFIIFVEYFYEYLIKYKKNLIIFIILFGAFFKYLYFSKEDNKFEIVKYFKSYEKINLDCKNKYFQGNSFRENFVNGKTIHPIFADDLTYFGFYQGAIIDQNINKIIDHNKNKNIKYLKNEKNTCYVDESTLRKIKFYTDKLKH